MAGVLIGGLSLIVSLYVLWATRLRPARLKLAAEPGSYRTIFESGRLRLRLPVVVANEGARHGVVTGLRFKVPDLWNSNDQYAFVHRTYASMDRDDARRFFEPIAVQGGAMTVSMCEFHIHQVDAANVVAGSYVISLEVPRARSVGVDWIPLGAFKLRVTDLERAGFDRPMTHFNGFRA